MCLLWIATDEEGHWLGELCARVRHAQREGGLDFPFGGFALHFSASFNVSRSLWISV